MIHPKLPMMCFVRSASKVAGCIFGIPRAWAMASHGQFWIRNININDWNTHETPAATVCVCMQCLLGAAAENMNNHCENIPNREKIGLDETRKRTSLQQHAFFFSFFWRQLQNHFVYFSTMRCKHWLWKSSFNPLIPFLVVETLQLLSSFVELFSGWETRVQPTTVAFCLSIRQQQQTQSHGRDPSTSNTKHPSPARIQQGDGLKKL